MRRQAIHALIIEDREDDALQVVRALTEQGFDVTWKRAGSPLAVAACLRAGPWDVVLSDHALPGIDAQAGLRVLQETGQDIPFIVVSDAMGASAAMALMGSGAHDCVLRDQLGRLGAAVGRELGAARLRREHSEGLEKVHHLERVLAAIRRVGRLIVSAEDPGTLLDGVCECLVDTRGYDATWIALLGESGAPHTVRGRGFGTRWPGLSDRLQRGEFPPCAAAALGRTEAIVIRDHTTECDNCQVRECFGDHRSLAARMEHQGRVYGVIGVTLLDTVPVDDSEGSLLTEVAGDLALALGSMQQRRSLAAQTALTSASLAAMPDCLLVVDPGARRVVQSNAEFRRLTGYTADEVRSVPAPHGFIDARDHARLDASMAVLRDMGRDQVELNLVARDGERIPMEFRVSTLPSDAEGERLHLVVGRNLAERRRAEAAARASARRYRALFDSSRDALMTMGPPSWRFTACNTACLTLFGVEDEAEFVGRAPWEYSPEHQPDGRRSVDAARERFDAALRDGSCLFEWTYRRVSGQDFPSSVLLTRTEVDGATFLQATVRDETEAKALRAAAAQTDRLASMGMLAAGVAHEINNPLAYLLFNLESVMEDLPHLSCAWRNCIDQVVRRLGTEDGRELLIGSTAAHSPALVDDIRSRLTDALEGAGRIKVIARDLGTFSRPESDQLSPIDVAMGAEIAISLAFNEIKYRARLVKDYGTVPMILGNEGRLSQVFLNLLVNAAQAISPGYRDQNEIRIRTWHDGTDVVAEVRDTGRGIPPADLPHVFEPFFSTKDIGTGSGLGLAISRSIVESFGGRIELTSELGRGTRCEVRLPAVRPQAHAEPATLERAGSTPNDWERILVVDDEPGIRHAITQILRDHTVVTAASGNEARALIEADPAFALILCDVMMPSGTGIELHEWLAGAYPDLAGRVIFITGGTFAAQTTDYLQRIPNLRIDKPFDLKSFIKTVREALLRLR